MQNSGHPIGKKKPGKNSLKSIPAIPEMGPD